MYYLLKIQIVHLELTLRFKFYGCDHFQNFNNLLALL